MLTCQLRKRDGADGKLSATVRWLRNNENLVLVQMSPRSLRPRFEDNGPVEVEHNIRRHQSTRAQVFRDRPRTQRLLRLLPAGRRGPPFNSEGDRSQRSRAYRWSVLPGHALVA